jgi:hypothetical protein
MDPGTGQEAFSSKTAYVMARLEKLPDQEVFKIAKQVLDDYPNDKLFAAVEKIEESKFLISSITRNDLAKALDVFSMEGIGGKRDELLGQVWPHYATAQTMVQLFSSFSRTQGIPQNLSNSEVLKHAGFATVSQK